MQKTNTMILDGKCLEAARKQFCLDIGLPWEEYVANRSKSVFIQKSVYAPGTLDIACAGARNYAEKTSFFRAMICLGQLFICCDESIYEWVVEQYSDCKPEWFCAFRNLRKLEEKLQEHGHRIYDTHVYFLPEAVDNVGGYERDGGQTEGINAHDRWGAEVKNSCLKSNGQSGLCVNGEEACGHNTDPRVGRKLMGETMVAGESAEHAEKPLFQLIWYDQEEILRFKENNQFTSAISF